MAGYKPELKGLGFVVVVVVVVLFLFCFCLFVCCCFLYSGRVFTLEYPIDEIM